uniref:Uncharacterized protein n=1 Tax=Chenopodium quinoa TaxID=63459 RepID=A0A803MEE3_CHEQI
MKYCHVLRNSGKEVELIEYPKVGHFFYSAPELPEYEIDSEAAVLKYGMWLKASPWKVNKNSEENYHGQMTSSCAKKLFVTKPKESEKKQHDPTVQVMTKKMSEIGVTKATTAIYTDVEDTVENVEMNKGDDMIGEGEDNEAEMMHLDSYEGNEGSSKKKRTWKKLEKGGSSAVGEGKVSSGVKRVEREEGIIEGKLIESEAGVTVKRRDITQRLEEVAGPTSWALGEP